MLGQQLTASTSSCPPNNLARECGTEGMGCGLLTTSMSHDSPLDSLRDKLKLRVLVSGLGEGVLRFPLEVF